MHVHRGPRAAAVEDRPDIILADLVRRDRPDVDLCDLPDLLFKSHASHNRAYAGVYHLVRFGLVPRYSWPSGVRLAWHGECGRKTKKKLEAGAGCSGHF